MINIQKLAVGYLRTNCYIVSSDIDKIAVVIDPGGGYAKIKDYCINNSLNVEGILLTHGHFDHIMAVNDIKKQFPEAKVFIHELDAKMLRGEWNLAVDIGLPPLEHILQEEKIFDGQELVFGEMKFITIHTPGHTQGSVSYYLNGEYLFSGDTLFCDSYGRTDFYGSSMTELVQSINKLFAIRGDCKVLPGHNGETTLDYERVNNPIQRC